MRPQGFDEIDQGTSREPLQLCLPQKQDGQKEGGGRERQGEETAGRSRDKKTGQKRSVRGVRVSGENACTREADIEVTPYNRRKLSAFGARGPVDGVKGCDASRNPFPASRTAPAGVLRDHSLN